MKDWFCDMKMEGITFRYADVEALPEENICGLPVILFREDGKTVYKIDRAIGEGELVHNMVTMGW
jgi:tRNA pseudouridine-54 N-methylase